MLALRVEEINEASVLDAKALYKFKKLPVLCRDVVKGGHPGTRKGSERKGLAEGGVG